MGNAKRILIVTVNWLGDAVMTSPIFKAIKEKYPYGYIAVICVNRVSGVYQTNPYVDETILFDE
ncbi:MAG: lipopolysaccharide heptosyltransferase II, partial [Candidatus Omnitrophota bacterium]